MKKILFLIIAAILLTHGVFASSSLETSLQADGKVSVRGYSAKAYETITIVVYDDYRKYYINQCISGSDGFFSFDFSLDADKKYSGRVKIGTEGYSFQLSAQKEDEKGYAYITVKGYKGNMILSKTKFSFDKGDTVLDITKRVLDDNDISYSAQKGYIKSISGLSDFDYGAKSGWMYKVNNEFPDVGASSVTVRNNDSIEWLYTSDMGKDIDSESKNNDEISKKIEKNKKLLKAEANQANRIAIISEIIDIYEKKSGKMGKKDDTEKLIEYIDIINGFISNETTDIKEGNAKKLFSNTLRLEACIKKLVNRKCEQQVYEKLAGSISSIIDTQGQIIETLKEVGNYEYMIYDSMQYAYDLNIVLNKYISADLNIAADRLLKLVIDKYNTVYVEPSFKDGDNDYMQFEADAIMIPNILENSYKKIDYLRNKFKESDIGNSAFNIILKNEDDESFVLSIEAGVFNQLKKFKHEKIYIRTSSLILSLGSDFVDSLNNSCERLMIKAEYKKADGIIKLDVFNDKNEAKEFAGAIEISADFDNLEEDIEKLSLIRESDNKRIDYEYDKSLKQLRFNVKQADGFIIKSFENIFTDLNDYPEIKDKCETMAAKGFINGKSENRFCPEEFITKVELIIFISRIMHLDYEETDSCPFVDTDKSKWYYKEIAGAYKNGLIKGAKDGYFYPDKLITRQETAQILAQAIKGLDITLFDEDIELEAFNDKEKIEPWAYDAVRTVSNLDIMSSDEEGGFNPLSNISRGDICEILYRFYEVINEK